MIPTDRIICLQLPRDGGEGGFPFPRLKLGRREKHGIAFSHANKRDMVGRANSYDVQLCNSGQGMDRVTAITVRVIKPALIGGIQQRRKR